MNKIDSSNQKLMQPLERFSLLRKLSQGCVNGRLEVFNNLQQWSIFFDKGKLIYACQSKGMWDIFYNKLLEIKPDFLTFGNQAHNQLQLIFDCDIDAEIPGKSQYLAICWLYNQQYLNSLQVAKLIEEVAVKVVDSYLTDSYGVYKFVPTTFLDVLPKFCYIDISLIIKKCELRSINIGKFISPVYANNYSPSSSSIAQKEPVSLKTMYAFQKHDAGTNTVEVENKLNNIGETDLKEQNEQLYKVICIDDNPIILKVIRAFLDEQIFDVIGVDDPLKALMQIIRTKPDIILLDITMPNLDGYELCSMLRKHSSFRDIPIILVTGRSSFLDKARARMVKASGYLSKPFSKSDLLKTVFKEIGSIR